MIYLIGTHDQVIMIETFLAHRSQAPGELKGWQPMSSVVVHTLELEYLCSLLADLNQILSVASDVFGGGLLLYAF